MRRIVVALVVAACATGVALAADDDKPCTARSFEGAVFTVCTFDVARHDLRVVWHGPDGQALRSFAAAKQALRLDPSRVRFAMNAGMYDDMGAPIGYFVMNGRRARKLNTQSGEGNFFLKPNGAFVVDHTGARIVETEAFVVETKAAKGENLTTIVEATQSGPMLVIDGELHPSFQADGPSRFVRNGVGVRDPSQALFAISAEPVSFGKLARFFRDGLECPNALYLDGTVSSLWVPAQGRMDDRYPLGPMVIVEDKRPPE